MNYNDSLRFNRFMTLNKVVHMATFDIKRVNEVYLIVKYRLEIITALFQPFLKSKFSIRNVFQYHILILAYSVIWYLKSINIHIIKFLSTLSSNFKIIFKIIRCTWDAYSKLLFKEDRIYYLLFPNRNERREKMIIIVVAIICLKP